MITCSSRDWTSLDQASIDSAVEASIEKFGRIDALLNNAGYGAYGPLEVFPMESIQRQFDTNVIGLLAVTKAILPHMRQQKSGIIANVSSVGGKITFPLGALYHGTKFAVEGISEALHYELEPLGIRVKIIEPGAIATDFGGRSFDMQNDESIAEYQPTVQAVMGMLGSCHGRRRVARGGLCGRDFWRQSPTASDKMRYPAAGGAEQFLASRQGVDDATFFARTKEMTGLSQPQDT